MAKLRIASSEKKDGNNILIKVEGETGIPVTVRISYRNGASKRSKRFTPEVNNVYIQSVGGGHSWPVEIVTNTVLEIERRAQWLLEMSYQH